MTEQVLKPVPADTTLGMPGITVPLPQQQVPKVKGPPLTKEDVEAVLSETVPGPTAQAEAESEKPTRRQKRAAKAAALGMSVKELKAAKKAGKLPAMAANIEAGNVQPAKTMPEEGFISGSQPAAKKGVPIRKGNSTAPVGKPGSKAIKTFDRLVSETLEEIDELATWEDRLDALRATGPNLALNDVLALAFNDSVISQLPETVPPYTPADSRTHPAHFRVEAQKMLRYFVNSPAGRGVKPHRREQLYIQMLEGIHPKDAEMISSIFAGIWPYPNIDREMVKRAKPGLFPK